MILIAFADVRCDTNDDEFKLKHKLNRQTDLCVKFMNLCVKCLTNGSIQHKHARFHLNTTTNSFAGLSVGFCNLIKDRVCFAIGRTFCQHQAWSEMNSFKLDKLISVSCIVTVDAAHKSWKISKSHYRNWIWPRGNLDAAPLRTRLTFQELCPRQQNIIISIISKNSHSGRSLAFPSGSYNLLTTQWSIISAESKRVRLPRNIAIRH